MSALKTAERSLAEHAELARKLASWNSERGDQFLMERLEAQAEAEDQHSLTLRRIVAVTAAADELLNQGESPA